MFFDRRCSLAQLWQLIKICKPAEDAFYMRIRGARSVLRPSEQSPSLSVYINRPVSLGPPISVSFDASFWL